MQLPSIGTTLAGRPLRGRLAGLVLAGALAGVAGPAAAQYGGYAIDDYGQGYDRGYAERYDRDYGRGYGYRGSYDEAPRPPRRVARVSARDYGLAEVDRVVRTQGSTIVDGRRTDGARVRLIFDGYSGALRDRIVLQEAPRTERAPRVARVDPREDRAPGPRLVPRPPERPASLKPPGQASAPATVVPPSPAAPVRPASPELPEPRPPASASAPATVVPSAPATPPAPTPGASDPATGAAKPALVNPQDVRGSGDAERKPPLASAAQPVIEVAPVQLPPVQIEDMTTAAPRPQTPSVPVTPLE